MSKGRFERKKQTSKGGRVALIVLIVLLLLAVAAGIGGVIYYNSMLNKMNRVDVPKIQYTTAPTEEAEVPAQTTEAPTEESTEAPTETVHIPSSEDYVNILLVGQASRWGADERAADTMILVTLNKYEKTIKLTSFLRDSQIHSFSYGGRSYGGIKLTTVYHLGSYYNNGSIAASMELMNYCLFQNFGIEVDHNFEVDFEAFVKIIDKLGGIEVDLTQAEADYLNLCDDTWVKREIQPGLQTLDGKEALCYARMRHAAGDNESDITRTSRQRKLIGLILDKVKTMSITDLQAMANEILPYVTTSMTNSEITDMLLTVLPMVSELQIEASGTCPVEGTYRGYVEDIYKDGRMHSVLKFTPTEQKKLMRAITEGEITE